MMQVRVLLLTVGSATVELSVVVTMGGTPVGLATIDRWLPEAVCFIED